MAVCTCPGREEMLVQHLRQAYRSAVQAELDAAGLQEVSHPLLLCILRSAANGQGLTQRELAQRLGVSPAAVTTSLKSLEKRGYIHREPEPQDARRNRVCLTERGQQAVEACAGCFQRVNQRMSQGLTAEERQQIKALFQRMLENLKKS
mgnify:CR=1 FL=1